MEQIALLIFTIIVELTVALCFLGKANWRSVVLAVIGVNLISHPIIWQAIFSYGADWFVAEACVLIFEAAVFALIFKNRRLLAAFTAVAMNFVTAAIGLLFF